MEKLQIKLLGNLVDGPVEHQAIEDREITAILILATVGDKLGWVVQDRKQIVPVNPTLGKNAEALLFLANKGQDPRTGKSVRYVTLVVPEMSAIKAINFNKSNNERWIARAEQALTVTKEGLIDLDVVAAIERQKNAKGREASTRRIESQAIRAKTELNHRLATDPAALAGIQYTGQI